jgi:hypothetical protein
MQDKAGQVPQHLEEVRIRSPRFFFSIINLLLLFGVRFHQVFEKLRRVFMHIDTRALRGDCRRCGPSRNRSRSSRGPVNSVNWSAQCPKAVVRRFAGKFVIVTGEKCRMYASRKPAQKQARLFYAV